MKTLTIEDAKAFLSSGAAILDLIEEDGYEIRLEWMMVPYVDAPPMHWSPHQSFSESGVAAKDVLMQWFNAWNMPSINRPFAGIRNIKLSRRKVGPWES